MPDKLMEFVDTWIAVWTNLKVYSMQVYPFIDL